MRKLNLLTPTLLLSLLLAGSAPAATLVGTGDSVNLGDVALGDVFEHENGKLEYSGFLFLSPGHDVASDELTVVFLDDGLRIEGPVSAVDEHEKFFVSYEVAALDPTMPIIGASLEQESSVSGSRAGVSIDKWFLGERERRRHDERRKHKKHKNRRGHGHQEEGPWNHAHSEFPGKRRGHGELHDGDHEGDGKGSRGLIGTLETFERVVGSHWDCYDDECEDCVQLFDETEFDREQERIRVFELVKLWSGEGDEAVFESATNRFALVPEPASAALLGLGFVGLGLAGRSRRR